MKKHRIFNKGDLIFCLLSSYNKPNVLIPVRCVIMDVKWDPINPKYQIKILDFFDTIPFLKRYFFDMNFAVTFDGKAKPLSLKRNEFTSTDSLKNRLNENDAHRFYVVVDSIMCVKTKKDLQDLFQKVQFYLISKNFKEIRETTARNFFTGPFSVDSTREFDVKFKRMWGDNFKDKLDIDKYLDSLN